MHPDRQARSSLGRFALYHSIQGTRGASGQTIRMLLGRRGGQIPLSLGRVALLRLIRGRQTEPREGRAR